MSKTEENKSSLEPVVDWYARAEALGWPRSELDGLASLLAIRSISIDEVVHVNARRILIRKRYTMTFRGIGADGKESAHDHQVNGIWSWRHHPPPESYFAETSTERPWCSSHAYECDPEVVGECGYHTRTKGLVRKVFCNCTRYPHAPGCDLVIAFAGQPASDDPRLERARAAMREQLGHSDASFEAAPRANWTPPAVEVKRPSRSNDWLMPGQTKLALGVPATAPATPAGTK